MVTKIGEEGIDGENNEIPENNDSELSGTQVLE
jgi:hypothetical protein